MITKWLQNDRKVITKWLLLCNSGSWRSWRSWRTCSILGSFGQRLAPFIKQLGFRHVTFVGIGARGTPTPGFVYLLQPHIVAKVHLWSANHAEEFVRWIDSAQSHGYCKPVLVCFKLRRAYFRLVNLFFPKRYQILWYTENTTLKFVAHFPVFALRWLHFANMATCSPTSYCFSGHVAPNS